MIWIEWGLDHVQRPHAGRFRAREAIMESQPSKQILSRRIKRYDINWEQYKEINPSREQRILDLQADRGSYEPMRILVAARCVALFFCVAHFSRFCSTCINARRFCFFWSRGVVILSSLTVKAMIDTCRELLQVSAGTTCPRLVEIKLNLHLAK